ncbi:hypothetical protein [Laspinema olomoucense]|uniref:hypothetical protein n=1 Tax=Laspinema olomoucense TaxID=3231600 RepID=UPI0021BB39EF|nr:hypothetical protein [Laspinema sp. D3a]MCT7988622.1 hypothetical protein [Laspinema sp. D3a]
MSDSSKRSIGTIATEDYISKTLASTLLAEILKDEAVEPQIKNRILEKYSSFLEESSCSRYLVKDLSLAVFSSIEEIEIIAAEGVKIDFYEANHDLIQKVDLEALANEEIGSQPDERLEMLTSAHTESPALAQQIKKTLIFRTRKCENPHDDRCKGIRSLRISF